MSLPRSLSAVLAAAVLLLTAVPLPAQPADPAPQDKLLAKRAAQLDAYRLLAERILGLSLRSDTTVRDFVTESDKIASALDTFIKGVRFSEPRYFEDGSCEVDAEVTLQQVVTTLRKIHEEVYDGSKWKREYFDEIEKNTETKVISVTGSGAPRPEAVVPDPAQAEIVREVVRPLNIPAIFKQYPPNERLKAKRAAELDAYRLLMERVYGLAIRADTTVRDFVTESDTIRTATDGHLRGARSVHTRYLEDGTVEVDMEITIEQVVKIIKRVHEEVYDGTKWNREYFDDIQKNTRRKIIRVTGTGALDVKGAPRNTAGKASGRVTQEKIEDEVIVVE